MQVLAPAAMETAPWRSGGCWRQCQLPSWYLHQPGAAFFVLVVLTHPLQICVFINVFPYSHSRSAQVNHLREFKGIDRFFWSLQCSGTPELGVIHGNLTPASGMCSHHLPLTSKPQNPGMTGQGTATRAGNSNPGRSCSSAAAGAWFHPSSPGFGFEVGFPSVKTFSDEAADFIRVHKPRRIP